jgi:hypothetical protein
MAVNPRGLFEHGGGCGRVTGPGPWCPSRTNPEQFTGLRNYRMTLGHATGRRTGNVCDQIVVGLPCCQASAKSAC